MNEQPPRAFVDTNIWVSAFINPHGAPAQIIEAFRRGQFIPVISEAFIDELRAVLSRERIRRRFRVTPEAVTEILALLREAAVETFPSGLLKACRDPRDDLLLETAVDGRAQFVVSRDDDIKRDPELIAHLQERGIAVVSVAQFLHLLAIDAA